MSKIKEFFSKIRDFFTKSGTHEKLHVLIGFIVPFVLYLAGTSFILSLIMGGIFGLVFEVIYCYAPMKEVVLFNKFKINVPDFKKWRENIKNGDFEQKNDFNNENYKYNFLGIFLSVILIILIKIF